MPTPVPTSVPASPPQPLAQELSLRLSEASLEEVDVGESQEEQQQQQQQQKGGEQKSAAQPEVVTDGPTPEEEPKAAAAAAAAPTTRTEMNKEDGPQDLRVFELNSDSGKSTPSNNGKKGELKDHHGGIALLFLSVAVQAYFPHS